MDHSSLVEAIQQAPFEKLIAMSKITPLMAGLRDNVRNIMFIRDAAALGISNELAGDYHDLLRRIRQSFQSTWGITTTDSIFIGGRLYSPANLIAELTGLSFLAKNIGMVIHNTQLPAESYVNQIVGPFLLVGVAVAAAVQFICDLIHRKAIKTTLAQKPDSIATLHKEVEQAQTQTCEISRMVRRLRDVESQEKYSGFIGELRKANREKRFQRVLGTLNSNQAALSALSKSLNVRN
ncbi:Uncharacterised protein [Candidatus Bilamarchaeum dharawalense]|uniref:Uncharacterized protein n=1 Tax=Candidatus Bilamarchaeum dharawalense TaxID=2885759 RepID=A0A5E4LXG2_9ARCH|nr:Uncharacterised protein [Candidatus Bilamarchaeum dharawalense]